MQVWLLSGAMPPHVACVWSFYFLKFSFWRDHTSYNNYPYQHPPVCYYLCSPSELSEGFTLYSICQDCWAIYLRQKELCYTNSCPKIWTLQSVLFCVSVWSSFLSMHLKLTLMCHWLLIYSCAGLHWYSWEIRSSSCCSCNW